MIISGKYEVPDKCPENCKFIDDLEIYGQNSICFRCPVLNCSEEMSDDPPVDKESYREDWAKEWVEFFKNNLRIPFIKP